MTPLTDYDCFFPEMLGRGYACVYAPKPGDPLDKTFIYPPLI